jgi:hypothetical protein
MDISLNPDKKDGICWNEDPIRRYAERESELETKLKAMPSIRVVQGSIACNGCAESDLGNGTFCTARLAESQVLSEGQKDKTVYSSSVALLPGVQIIKPGSERLTGDFASRIATAVVNTCPPRVSLRYLLFNS